MPGIDCLNWYCLNISGSGYRPAGLIMPMPSTLNLMMHRILCRSSPDAVSHTVERWEPQFIALGTEVLKGSDLVSLVNDRHSRSSPHTFPRYCQNSTKASPPSASSFPLVTGRLDAVDLQAPTDCNPTLRDMTSNRQSSFIP